MSLGVSAEVYLMLVSLPTCVLSPCACSCVCGYRCVCHAWSFVCRHACACGHVLMFAYVHVWSCPPVCVVSVFTYVLLSLLVCSCETIMKECNQRVDNIKNEVGACVYVFVFVCVCACVSVYARPRVCAFVCVPVCVCQCGRVCLPVRMAYACHRAPSPLLVLMDVGLCVLV